MTVGDKLDINHNNTQFSCEGLLKMENLLEEIPVFPGEEE